MQGGTVFVRAPAATAWPRKGLIIIKDMLDLFFVLITILFFLISWAYVRGCDRL